MQRKATVKYLSPYRKAITAGLAAGLTALASVLAHGSVTPQDWLSVLAAVLVAGGLTYRIPNTPASTPPAAPPATP
jgi:hypothetical protein